jgi:iron complex outermembrane recepter protein
MNFAGRAALLNATLFYTQIKNFQVVSFIGTGFAIFTAPAESQGLELEGQWAVTQDFTLGLSGTYAKATEKDTGMRLPYAPQWSASLNAQYQIPWQQRSLAWLFGGVLNYRGEEYMQSGERNLDDALTLLDLRVALASADNSWEVALIGRNMLDEESSFGFDFPFFGGRGDIPVGAATMGSLNRPLTVALQLRYDF